MPDDRPSNGPNLRAGFLVAGSEMASFTVAGLLLDYFLGTMPGFTIGLTLLGLVAAFFHLTRLAKLLAAKKSPPSSGAAP